MSSFENGHSSPSDESFGPGTDLVISLLAALMLILVQVIQSEEPQNDEPVEIEPKPVQERRPQQIIEIKEKYEEEPLFEKNKAKLTPRMRQELRMEMPAFRSALQKDCCNQLLIEGHASPEAPSSFPRDKRERWNLSLSVDRSMAVVDFLYENGIPYECMSVAGFGRSHSTILGNWLRAEKSRSIRSWDGHSDAMPPNTTEAQDLASERLVKISGIYHENSVCAQ